MSTWMTALGNMGASITSVKDVYKPTDNITSTWSSLAKNLVAAAGTIGLTALAGKTSQATTSTPVLRRTVFGVPIPSVVQAGQTAPQQIGSPAAAVLSKTLSPSAVSTELWIAAGVVVVAIILVVAMRPSGVHMER
jgi:hypothetical protein